MTRVLVVEPSPTDPVGPLGTWLRDAGAELSVVRPQAGDPVPPDLGGVDVLVVLGGEVDADDDAGHPWLPGVRDLLRAAVDDAVPTLALCLGAQLLAVATGGTVRAAPGGPQAGWEPVDLTPAAAADPLLAGLGPRPGAIWFHSHEVDRLPPGSVALAASPGRPHQAFRTGRCAWGLQLHLETDAPTLRAWAAASPGVAAALPAAQREPGVLEAHHAELARTWRPVAARLVDLGRRRRGGR